MRKHIVSAEEYFNLHELVGNILGYVKLVVADNLKINDKIESIYAAINVTKPRAETVLVKDQGMTCVVDNEDNQLSSAKLFSAIVKDSNVETRLKLSLKPTYQ